MLFKLDGKGVPDAIVDGPDEEHLIHDATAEKTLDTVENFVGPEPDD